MKNTWTAGLIFAEELHLSVSQKQTDVVRKATVKSLQLSWDFVGVHPRMIVSISEKGIFVLLKSFLICYNLTSDFWGAFGTISSSASWSTPRITRAFRICTRVTRIARNG